MQRSIFVVLILIVFSMFYFGCEQGMEPASESQSTTESMQFSPSSNLLWPAGQMVDQAVFSIYVTGSWANDVVEVYSLTTDWTEFGVNWNWADYINNADWISDGGDMGTKLGEFNIIWNDLGWYDIDVTALVNSWITNGGSNNFGILLKHNENIPEFNRVSYHSSEYPDVSLRPKFTLYHDNTNTIIQRGNNDNVFDSWFDSGEPDYNHGTEQNLQTRIQFDGNIVLREKRVVVKFPLDIEEQQEPSCETAFAYGNDKANCFILWEEFSNWGWTNGSLGTGTYTWDIYAGAGQCDLTKGTVVGTLTLDYDGSTADVTYDMDQGFTLSETHLYIGNDPFPSSKKGKITNAPGRYPFKHNLSDASSDSFTVTGLSGNIYVIAHAVVCGQF